jgi:hypothetical protein
MKKYEINSEIYSEDVINQGIIDFEEVSNIKFENNKLIISSEDSEEIFNEFMNYCISLISE